MTNKEKAQELWGVLADETRSLEERRAAREALLELKKVAKTSILKLLGDAVGDQHDVDALMDADLDLPPLDAAHAVTEVDPLDEPIVEDVKAGKPLDPAKAKAHVEGAVRGLITAEVKRLLLETDDPYADIVAAVKALHPEALTTARSVASVASDMRKAGKAVAVRRKEAGK